MRFALHHLQKDLRAMWPFLALWLAILALRSFVPVDESFETVSQTQRLQSVLMLIQWALVAVLPAVLILQDPVHGARAFWPTRPISRLDLLISKALGLALLFVLLPLAFQCVSLWRLGLGGRALALALAESAFQIGGVVLAAAAVASVSSSLARFVVLFVTCVVGAKLLGPVVLGVTALSAERYGWPSLWNSQVVAEMALLLFAATSILVHQSLTRRTSRSLALVGMTALALSWVPSLPWDFLGPAARPLRGTVTVDLEPPDDQHCFRTGFDPTRVEVCGRFLFADLGNDLDLEIERIESRLLFPDGTSIEHRGSEPGTWVHSQIVVNGSVEVVDSVAASHTLLTPRRELYRRYAEVAGELEAEIVFRAVEVRSLGALPIERGASLRAGDASATIGRATISGSSPPTLDFEIRLRWAELLFAPRTWLRKVDARFEHRLVDPPFDQHTSGGISGLPDAGLVLSRPRLRSAQKRETLRFRDRRDWKRDERTIELPSTAEEVPAWLRDAELVIEERFRSGTYRTHLRVDGFRMADYSGQEEG